MRRLPAYAWVVEVAGVAAGIKRPMVVVDAMLFILTLFFGDSRSFFR
jgi:uncharacterized membrane protein YtjA (UPF0391 family)